MHIRLIHSAAAKAALIAAASLALVAAGTAAFAGTHHAPKAAAASSPITVCVGSAKTYSPTRVVFNLHTDGTTTCPSGSFATSWNKAGPQGIQGPPGPAASDVDGSLGGSWSLAAPAPVQTGGSFSQRSTDIGSLALKAGTYLVSVNFKATPDATTGGDVFPVLTVYNGPFTGDFSADLFNAGAGALEDPTAAELSGNDLIDSYFSGSGVVTVPAGGETLHFLAFGYDSDTGAGSYEMDTASVAAVQVGS